jgi:hypothetical protein
MTIPSLAVLQQEINVNDAELPAAIARLWSDERRAYEALYEFVSSMDQTPSAAPVSRWRYPRRRHSASKDPRG